MTAQPTPGGVYIPRGKGPPPAGEPIGWRRAALQLGRLAVFALAVIGGLLGLGVLWIHVTSDPLIDSRAYFEAARRLNDGVALYPEGADSTAATFYRYPPLLAILLRPFANLPYHVFAIGWEVVVVASFVALLRRLGATRRTFLAVGLLGVPIGWALGIAQAHVPMTLLIAIGQPWSIALATNIKLFPVLVAVWWVGRARFQAAGALAGWLILFAGLQWLIEPDASTAYLGALSLEQAAGVRNISPFVISPILWAALAVAGAVGALFLAPTRWGWAAAVALATLASPRLLLYMLTGLLAAVREPDPPRGEGHDDLPTPDAAEVYVSSAR